MADRVIGRMVYRILGDDKDLQKSLVKSQKALETAGRKMQSIGKSLSLGLTLPIVGIGTAMVKSAIDAEETRAKFETAFRGITDAADETVSGLQDGYGLARQEAEKLLSNTGDLLKGFGASADQALGLSDQVQRLAVDLASYNNLQGGAARASEIITKGMLGEREAYTQLGIKISEADVQQRLLEKGQKDLTGRALLLAKAQATLELAYSQSGDALGDYNRTQDSTANQIRKIKADIKDISVQIGRELLPTVRSALQTVRDWIDTFNDLNEENKDLIKDILKIAGLLAAAGPILLGLGKVATAIKGIIGLIAASNPVGLIATAIAAGIALGATADEADRAAANISGISPGLHGIRDLAKKTKEEFTGITHTTADAVDEANKLKGEFRQIAEEAERNKESQKDITDEMKLQKSMATSTYSEYWAEINQRWENLNGMLDVYSDNLQQIRKLEDPERKLRELELLEQELELDIGMLEQEEQFPVTAAARRALLEEIAQLQTELEGSTERQLTNTQKTIIAMNDARDAAMQGAKSTGQWDDYLESLKADASDVGDVLADSADAAFEAWGSLFAAIGDNIVTWELSVESLKEVFKGLFTSVLKAMGEEYAIKAAVSLIPGLEFNPAAFAGFTAASAAAYTAAGMVSAFGEGGSFYADDPRLILVGDRPEYVNIEPVDHVRSPGAGSGAGDNYNFYGDIYGYEDFAEQVEKATHRAARIGRVER